MHRSRLASTFLIIALLSAWAAGQAPPVNVAAGSYDDSNSPFTTGNGQVYHINGDISVPANKKLTIPPGAILKFADDAAFCVLGELDADGTPGSGQILLTSIHDVATDAGGDTAGTGMFPFNGAWIGVLAKIVASPFSAAKLSMKRVTFRFAGGDSLTITATGGALIYGEGTAGCVEDSRFESIKGAAVTYLPSNGNPSTATVRNTHISDSDKTIENCPFTVLSQITGNTTDGTVVDKTITVERETNANGGTVNVTPQNTIDNEGKINADDGIEVDLGDKLCLSVDVSVGSSRDITIRGTFDFSQGDISGTGWTGVDVPAGGDATFFNATIEDAVGPAISVDGGGLNLSSSTIRNSDDGLEVLSTTPGVKIESIFSAYLDIPGSAIEIPSIDRVGDLTGNTATNVGEPRVTVTNTEAVTTNVTVGPSNLIGDELLIRPGEVVFDGTDITYKPGVTISLSGDGMTYKNGAEVTIDAPADPVIVRQDPNLIGDPAQPQTHTGIKLEQTAGQFKLRGFTVFDAGRNGSPGVIVDSFSSGEVSHLKILGASGPGLVSAAIHLVMTNVLVAGCAGDGITTTGTSFIDIASTTVADNQGFGVNGSVFSTFRNGISWGNALGNYGPNMSAGNVFASNGGFNGQAGNIDQDPQFIDPPSWNFGLSATSPSLGAGDPNFGILDETDINYAPRISDWDRDGIANLDQGAWEMIDSELVFSGEARLGDTVYLEMTGPMEFGYYFAGPGGDGGTFGSYGRLLTGFPSETALIGAPLPIQPGNMKMIEIPDFPPLVGFGFALQGLLLPVADPSVGNFTNAGLFEILD